MCGLLQRKELLCVCPPIHYLSLCKELSTPLPWKLLFKGENSSVLIWKLFQWFLFLFWGWFFFFQILLYFPFDKVAQNACSVQDLHWFIHQFDGIFFPHFLFFTFCSFYPFLTWFCLPFWPLLSIELTFWHNHSQWVQDHFWVITGKTAHHCVCIISAHAHYFTFTSSEFPLPFSHPVMQELQEFLHCFTASFRFDVSVSFVIPLILLRLLLNIKIQATALCQISDPPNQAFCAILTKNKDA